VIINGKAGKLDGLVAGQKAQIDYETTLEIVTKIEATGEALPAPELLEVSELNPAGTPWLSSDGLTIHYGTEGAVYFAHRVNPRSLFRNPQLLFKGSMPTLTGDGLEMVLKQGDDLYTTSRKSLDSQFQRPRMIQEIEGQKRVWAPMLSSDGLTLSFNRIGENGYELVQSKRSNRTANWSNPLVIPLQQSNLKGNLVWHFLSPDELSLICSHVGRADGFEKGNLMFWWRASAEEPFKEYRYIKVDGIPPLTGLAPRYVASTNELVFSRQFPKDADKKMGIWIVKDFVLQHPNSE
jgi:hypothetical protein